MPERGKGERTKRGRPRHASEISLADVRRLHRDPNVPMYFQLAAALLKKLDTGAWRPGTRFPSEREIADAFGVSRAVIRPALDLLVGDGAIEQIAATGAFVAPPRRQVPIFGLTRALSSYPADLDLTILSARKQPADAAIQHFLEMKGPEPVAHITAVLSLAGETICLIDSRTSLRLVPGVLEAAEDLQVGKRSTALQGVRFDRSPLIIEHTFFGRWGGPTVGVAAGDPALMGRLVQHGRVSKQKRTRPIEFARLIYRGDRIQLTLDLESDTSP